MIEFYKTVAGRQFFDGIVPKIVKSLELQNTLKIFEMRGYNS